MIEFINFSYNKEYKELIEAFIPDYEDKGLNMFIELRGNYLFIQIGTFEDEILIDNYFNSSKTNIKRSIYKFFRKYTSKDLKWGILVGVNPLKLFRKLLLTYSIEDTKRILKEGYFISEEKINLGFIVINNQSDLYENLKNKTSIYINIPFCPSKCHYCSYPTYLNSNNKIGLYMEKLLYEINRINLEVLNQISCIYVGGGTPSSIGYKRLDTLLALLRKTYVDVEEFTVEIGRPDTIDENILDVLKGNQVDRISINPQTMKNETLKRIGRKHSSQDIIKTFNLARKKGFDNINMDLILALPGEDEIDLKESLEILSELSPESVSLHYLSLKKGSFLASDGYYHQLNDKFEKIRDDFMEKSPYIPYYLYRQKNMYSNLENLGLSTKGKKAKYNIAMMEDLQNIIGLGLSSSSKNILDGKIKRHMNSRNLNDYINNIEDNIDKKVELFRSI